MMQVFNKLRNSSAGAPTAPQVAPQPSFVDAFAGCGGLSLGLKRSGWRGLFAIEKDAFAFDTLSTNFPAGDGPLSYDWPTGSRKGLGTFTNCYRNVRRHWPVSLARLTCSQVGHRAKDSLTLADGDQTTPATNCSRAIWSLSRYCVLVWCS